MDIPQQRVKALLPSLRAVKGYGVGKNFFVFFHRVFRRVYRGKTVFFRCAYTRKPCGVISSGPMPMPRKTASMEVLPIGSPFCHWLGNTHSPWLHRASSTPVPATQPDSRQRSTSHLCHCPCGISFSNACRRTDLPVRRVHLHRTLYTYSPSASH